mmetsp:Transcript_77366/g.107520  ORF Transcript_77366/g.107520 Transcript_77366/m.107520 type:complete len:231 (+) Transcript_77366:78-770(+)
MLVLGFLCPQLLPLTLVHPASLVHGAKAEPRLIWRIFQDEGSQLVNIVQFTGPTASIATSLDDALLDIHVDLRKVTVLATHVFLDEFVQRSPQVLHLVRSTNNGAFAFALLVGVVCLGTQIISKKLGHILRWTFDGSCHLTHVGNASLDSIAATLNFRHQAGHLVAVLRVGVRRRNIAHRHGCELDASWTSLRLVGCLRRHAVSNALSSSRGPLTGPEELPRAHKQAAAS